MSELAISEADLVNLCLQRSELMTDAEKPGWIIRAWSSGDDQPLLSYVRETGPVLVERAEALFAAQAGPLIAALQDDPPKRIADIGPGFGFIHIALHRAFGCEVVLIDTEESDERHFGYAENSAAYNNLATAKSILVANGVAGRMRSRPSIPVIRRWIPARSTR